jgi:hypothetical protein
MSSAASGPDGGGKLRLKLVIKRDEAAKPVAERPSMLDIPNGLVIGSSSVKVDIGTHQPAAPLQSTPSVPLSFLILKATQRSFRQLENIDELSGRMTDAERKGNLMDVILESRLVFAKILALVEWRERVGAVFMTEEQLDKIVNGKGMQLTELADRMCVKHYEYTRLDCPLYNIKAALKFLYNGTNQQLVGLPRVFTNYLDDERVLSDEAVKEEYIGRLNRLIATRMSLLVLPEDCQFKGIERGVAKLAMIRGEFVVELSLVPTPQTNEPKWFLINAYPSNTKAKDKIKGSLAVIMQNKYNSRPFNQDAIISIFSDLQLYLSLLFLHQLYRQLTLTKKTVSMRVDYGEGSVKVHFYPNAVCEKLLLSIQLRSMVVETVCSWQDGFELTPTFDCYSIAESILACVYERLCELLFDKLQTLKSYYQRVDNSHLLFTFLATFTATVSVCRQTGQYSVQIADRERVLVATPEEVERLLKREAANAFIDSLSTTDPRQCHSILSIEQSRIGSFPKLFLTLSDQVCLCVGMDEEELVMRRFLVFVRRHHRYRSLFSVVDWQDLGGGEVSGWNRVDVGLVRRFSLSSMLRDAGIDHVLVSGGGGGDEQRALCLNLPLHMYVESVSFLDESTVEIIVDERLFRPKQIQVSTNGTFQNTLKIVKLLLSTILIITQHTEHAVVGTWWPMNLMVGNDSVRSVECVVDEGQDNSTSTVEYSVLLNGQKWHHRLLPSTANKL